MGNSNNSLNNEDFDKFLDKSEARYLSNSQNYDKAILNLSTAGLGVSIGLMHTVIGLEQACWKLCLYGSWLLFFFAIAAVLASFR